MGNYYSSSVVNPSSSNIPTSSAGSRMSKRVQNNFLDNLEKVNFMIGINSQLNSGTNSKKRNKSVTKSYNMSSNANKSVVVDS